jgi:hypothetical protein
LAKFLRNRTDTDGNTLVLSNDRFQPVATGQAGERRRVSCGTSQGATAAAPAPAEQSAVSRPDAPARRPSPAVIAMTVAPVTATRVDRARGSRAS